LSHDRHQFIYDTFRDIYYTDEENRQLDYFNGNIQSYGINQIQRSIMYYLLFQSLIAKRPYNLFHRKNLYMRLAITQRSFGNKATWDRSFVEHMCHFRDELISLLETKQNIKSTSTYTIINYSYDEIPLDIIESIDPPYFKKIHVTQIIYSIINSLRVLSTIMNGQIIWIIVRTIYHL
jgi:hypothetical protein